jgi:hypothetical protein
MRTSVVSPALLALGATLAAPALADWLRRERQSDIAR